MSEIEEPPPESESEEAEAEDAASDEEEWDETVHQPHQGEEGQDIV